AGGPGSWKQRVRRRARQVPAWCATPPRLARAGRRVAGCWALSWLHLFGPAHVGRLMTPQPFAQAKSCPIQQHAHVADGQPELVGGLRVAEAIETGQAEDLRLAR